MDVAAHLLCQLTIKTGRQQATERGGYSNQQDAIRQDATSRMQLRSVSNAAKAMLCMVSVACSMEQDVELRSNASHRQATCCSVLCEVEYELSTQKVTGFTCIAAPAMRTAKQIHRRRNNVTWYTSERSTLKNRNMIVLATPLGYSRQI